jgi:hypothetical protein
MLDIQEDGQCCVWYFEKLEYPHLSALRLNNR